MKKKKCPKKITIKEREIETSRTDNEKKIILLLKQVAANAANAAKQTRKKKSTQKFNPG